MNSKIIKLYVHGVCPINPGAGSYGNVIQYEEVAEKDVVPVSKTFEFSQAFWLTTEVRLAIMAAVNGLEEIMRKIQDKTFESVRAVDLFSNSKYFCDALNQGWVDKWSKNNWFTCEAKKPKRIKNIDLWEQILNLKDDYKELGILINLWILGAREVNEFYDRAKELAVTSLTGDYGAYVSDVYYEEHNDLGGSKCYYTFGH